MFWTDFDECHDKKFNFSSTRSREATISRISTVDAPSGRIYKVYDVFELIEAKNRAQKAFRGPEHPPGTSQELLRGARRESRLSSMFLQRDHERSGAANEHRTHPS